MLLKNSTCVKLPKIYYKILHLYPAFNDTFVFLGMIDLKQDVITHVNKNGEILFEHIFHKPIDSFQMINERECVVL